MSAELQTQLVDGLQKLLNEIVITPNAIDGIIILDPKEGLSLYQNTEFSMERRGDDIHKNYEAIASSLSGIDGIMTKLVEFGKDSHRGELKYTVFQLTAGILLLYFLVIKEEPVVVAFISGTPDHLGLMLKHSGRNIKAIEDTLNKVL